MERSKSVVPSGIRHPSALRLPTIHQSANGFDDGRLNAALLSVVIGGELDELGFILQLEQLNIDVGDGQLQLASNSIQQLIARVVLVDFGHHSTQFLSLLDEGLHHIDAVQDESSSQKQISQFLRSQFAHRLQLRLDPAALPHLQRFDHHLHLGPAVQSVNLTKTQSCQRRLTWAVDWGRAIAAPIVPTAACFRRWSRPVDGGLRFLKWAAKPWIGYCRSEI